MRAAVFDSDVVIAGGGFAGLVTASAIARAGFHVIVLESLPGPTTALRGELVHPPGVQLLDSLGLLRELRAGDAVDLSGFAAYRHAEGDPILLPYETGPGLGLEHARIVEALRRALAGIPGARLLTGARVDGVLREGRRVIGVRSAGHGDIRAPLVIAADGRHSRLREAFGIVPRTELLSYTIGVALDREALPHRAFGHVFLGAPGPMLAYPLGSDHARMNVDVPLQAPRGREKLVGFLREQYSRHLPRPLREAFLDALHARPFIACATHAIVTTVCAIRGAALVGDAGGCSHPLTATGMTSALHDAVTLAHGLDARGPSDEALLEYQRRRYRYVRERESFAQALYDVFRGGDEGARGLREAVFRYWGDAEARRTSTAILAGDSAAVGKFAAEYARVVAIACGEALRDGFTRRNAEQVAAVLATAAGCLRMTVRNEVSARIAARTPWLSAPDRAQALARFSETEVPASAEPSSRTAARRTIG